MAGYSNNDAHNSGSGSGSWLGRVGPSTGYLVRQAIWGFWRKLFERLNIFRGSPIQGAVRRDHVPGIYQSQPAIDTVFARAGSEPRVMVCGTARACCRDGSLPLSDALDRWEGFDP